MTEVFAPLLLECVLCSCNDFQQLVKKYDFMGNEKIDIIQSFTYLGTQITSTENLTLALEQRRFTLWLAWALSRVVLFYLLLWISSLVQFLPWQL